MPGVHDDQRRAAPAGAACRLQAAQQVLDLADRLPGAGGRSDALDVDQGGPCGAQVPERGGELVFPAGDGLASAVAAAGVMVDVAAFRGAFGVRSGVGGGVDREPQPPPPGARLPDLRGVRGRHAGQGGFQQAVVDPVVLSDPGAAFVPVDERRQRLRQQRAERLLIAPACGQRVIQRAVAAAELRHQRQPGQRGHRVIGAQDRVAQLEQRICPRGQAPVQPGAELPQRHVPVNRAGHLRRIRRGRHHGRAAARRAAL